MECLAIVISVISIAISLLSWSIQRNSEIRTNINDLIREYRSTEMYFAIKQLWDLYRKSNKETDRLVKEYFRRHAEEEQKAIRNEGNPIEF